MQVHLDGGWCYSSNIVSWGVIVHHQGAMHELHGARRHTKMKPYCEVIALFEAIKFISQFGVTPRDVTFHSDCATVAYGGNALMLKAAPADQYGHALMNLVKDTRGQNKTIYSDHLANLVRLHILRSRFHKVRGHSGCVENLRCDYLARYARKHLVSPEKPFVPYTEWLKSWTPSIKETYRTNVVQFAFSS